jgi:hypothetical protein
VPHYNPDRFNVEDPKKQALLLFDGGSLNLVWQRMFGFSPRFEFDR